VYCSEQLSDTPQSESLGFFQKFAKCLEEKMCHAEPDRRKTMCSVSAVSRSGLGEHGWLARHHKHPAEQGKKGERVKAKKLFSQKFYMNFCLHRPLPQKMLISERVSILLVLAFSRSMYEAAQEFL
jgi:hypothetical protein